MEIEEKKETKKEEIIEKKKEEKIYLNKFGPEIVNPPKDIGDWRMKVRLKTINVGLVLCLNIGVDPPDVIKVYPCSTLECWTDPFSIQVSKPLETIGNKLKEQYERWQPKARYKLCLDPTVDEVKKSCLSLRRNAKKERVLFHFNGHGVPKPTNNGEFWVFNKNYTQYIPLSIYELHSWLGSPTIYVFDCSSAGTIIKPFLKYLSQNKEILNETIILGSCSDNENLPTNPNFPADLFTSCLTTPIKTALRWYCMNNKLLQNISMDLVDNLPGKITDRKTPLGELNWIFTAITDTIAWSILPRDLFQKLFREDLLVASLFRNFLLADRIMRSVKCTPISFPKLPSTEDHPLWNAWDHAIDMCLCQLPYQKEEDYKFSDFFENELTEFEVWLEFGSEKKKPPSQLPILLQVLLSQSHRLRALTLLGRFLDLGHWAVSLSLQVGIFPYVLKLLQSNSNELKKILTFIWAKIIALDKSCQFDIVKDGGHLYFINIVTSKSDDPDLKSLACFVLCQIMSEFPQGQEACLQQSNLLSSLASQLNDPDPLLRKWLCFTISKMLEDYDDGKELALQEDIHEKIADLLLDPVGEVRGAAICSLTSFIGHDYKQDSSYELKIGTQLYHVISDGDHQIRKELVIALSQFLMAYQDHVSPELLKQIIFEDKVLLRQRSESIKELSNISLGSSPKDMKGQEIGKNSYFALDLCRIILMLCSDPYKEVSELAFKVFRYMKRHFFKLSKQLEPPISLKSSFYELSCEYFSKPLLKLNILRDEIETPKMRWRKKRNQGFIQEAQLLSNESDTKRKLEDQIGFFNNQSDIISNIIFHPFDPFLVFSDARDVITVIDWNEAVRTNSFSSGMSRITDLKIINESQEDSMLMVTSASGNISFYKNFEKSEKLITAFKAVPEAIVHQKGPGIITEWQQQTGLLFVSGDLEFVKLWDLEKSICFQNIPTDINGSVTALSSDKINCNICAVGCGDGSLLLLDKRDQKMSVVSTVKEHENWIIDLKIQKGDTSKIISASGNGNVKIWDIRNTKKSLKTFNIQKGNLSALTIHDYVPIIACGSSNQFIKITNFNGDTLSSIYYHEGFLSQRIGPISALSFHPYKVCLAAGATDSIVSLYSGDTKITKKKK